MKLAQQRGLFLTFTGMAVVLLGFYIAASWHDYETERDNHRTSQHKGE